MRDGINKNILVFMWISFLSCNWFFEKRKRKKLYCFCICVFVLKKGGFMRVVSGYFRVFVEIWRSSFYYNVFKDVVYVWFGCVV